jgi:uncharacterized membrane protein YedE/YeeE
MTAVYLLLGTVFGFVLSRSGAADYGYIQAMFRFQSFQLYGILGTAVAVTAPGLFILKRHGRTAFGQPLVVKEKALNRGTVVGGALFGIGWSITGMCPGPIFVNVGEGKLYAIAAFAGALVGAAGFAWLQPRIAGLFGLPSVRQGTGESEGARGGPSASARRSRSTA